MLAVKYWNKYALLKDTLRLMILDDFAKTLLNAARERQSQYVSGTIAHMDGEEVVEHEMNVTPPPVRITGAYLWTILYKEMLKIWLLNIKHMSQSQS